MDEPLIYLIIPASVIKLYMEAKCARYVSFLFYVAGLISDEI